MDKKKTVIVGSSTNRGRYAWLAAQMLSEYNHTIVPLGIRQGEVMGERIQNIHEKPAIDDVDTITLYISPPRQKEHYSYLLSLRPKRIIFNPGTENPEFAKMAEQQGIDAIEACTLVLLRSNQY